MIEVVLLLVIIALCALLGWFDWNNRKERKSLLNALQAKNALEFSQLEMTDKTKIEIKEPQADEMNEDYVSMDQLTNDEFKKHVFSNEELENK